MMQPDGIGSTKGRSKKMGCALRTSGLSGESHIRLFYSSRTSTPIRTETRNPDRAVEACTP
ncbi:hypothetical protein A343_1856 [Porphyromonas gingivalis JCVI SC001]|nr:hypothetical protein A343_1856 [Porphyromonas gingivalis JCVI SC001]